MSIEAQLNHQRSDLDLWKEVIEKTVDVEAKASLQPLSRIKEINFRCLKGYRLLVKKEKDKASWKHQDENKDKAKSHNPSSTNISQPQTQASKKNKCYISHQGSH